MKSVEAFESITILKNKFEEIKNNILTIEKEKARKLGEYQIYQSFPKKFEYTRPSSTSKIRESPSDSYSSFREDPSEIIFMLKKQIKDLQDTNFYQATVIDQLKQENSILKSKLDEKVLSDNNLNRTRPQSCLKNRSSSPKKARVAFAKDLIKVQYISDSNEENWKNTQEIKNNSENFFTSAKEDRRRNDYRNEYETPPKVKHESHDLRGYMHEKRLEMGRLNAVSFDSSFPDYYRERSMAIAKKLLKD